VKPWEDGLFTTLGMEALLKFPFVSGHCWFDAFAAADPRRNDGPSPTESGNVRKGLALVYALARVIMSDK
jgi:hypothetical protein